MPQKKSKPNVADQPATQVKLGVVDAGWLPPLDEWDFRAIEEAECRFACLWEYVRSIRTFDASVPANVVRWVRGENGQDGKGACLKTGQYLCRRAGDLSKPYITINNIVYKKLSVEDFKDLPAFVLKLKRRSDTVSKFLWDNLSAATHSKLLHCVENVVPNPDAQASLVKDLNQILSIKGFYNDQRFAGVSLEGRTRIMQKEIPLEELRLFDTSQKDMFRYNKWVLEETYPAEIFRIRIMEPLDWRTFDAFSRTTLVQSMERIRKQMKEKIEDEHPPLEVIDQYLGKKHYALSVNFKRGSIKKITEELTAWVKREAKHFPSPRVGKATQPRNDLLRWLAAYRLELARIEAGVTFRTMKANLLEHQRALRVTDSAVTLPIYENQNAWIKVVDKATDLLTQLESDPATFEKKILY